MGNDMNFILVTKAFSDVIRKFSLRLNGVKI